MGPKSGFAGLGLKEPPGKCGCGERAPPEGATIIKVGELLIVPCENNIPHTSSVSQNTVGEGAETVWILYPKAPRHTEGWPKAGSWRCGWCGHVKTPQR